MHQNVYFITQLFILYVQILITFESSKKVEDFLTKIRGKYFEDILERPGMIRRFRQCHFSLDFRSLFHVEYVV